ncbi:TonB-dependent receptor [Phenylobacterium kunshanense]|uniref:TonB-dependent siderophore receptor n=1 Tax=Phenylobacterium kunshanense TaxID=1445034 RepID=A0A328BBW3_9CAUL|nr:TonB-dependent siderophore receptor [Phenylobacterium kunshanense]RAK65000.1 TonB-dependent siderophore receptor [Phenylobacterium kunshanense]
MSSKGVVARKKRAIVFAAAGVAGLSMGAAAQADEAVDAAPRGAEVSGLEVKGGKSREPEAPKYTAPLVDTPRSITVIPRQVIEQTAATSLTDILRTSPGITFGAGEGGQPLADRPFIRGQASANNIFVDGVRDSGGQTREVFAIEQVEVVKGADSAYSGRGSGGGSINLTSKRPRLDTFANATVSVGTDSYYRGTVDGNYQLGEMSAVRLNVMAMENDSPGRDAAEFSRYGVLAGVATGLGTATRATFLYYHLRTDDLPDYGVPLFTKTPGLARTTSGVLDVPRDSFYGLKARDYQETEADIATLIAEHDVSEAVKLRNVFRASKTLNDYVVTNPGDGGVAQLVGGQYWMKRGTKSRWNPAETVANVTDVYGKFDTGFVSHSYDVGLELSRERNKNAAYVVYTTAGAPCPAGFTGASNNLGVGDCTLVFAPNPDDPWQGTITRPEASRNITKTVGVYAFDTLSFGDRWLLNLGIRHDSYEVSGTDVAVTSANGVITGKTYTQRRGEWDFTNYQVGLVFKPTATSSLYVAYATTSTPPTIASGDQNTGVGTGTGNLANVLLDPEEVTNFEVGAKAALFGEKLSVSVAYFDLTRENAQIQVSPGVYAQAGEAQVKGVEIGVTGAVTDRWDVFGGYTYQDSELVRGAYNIVNVGDPLANTPKHNFSLFTTYEITDAFTIGGGAYYVSKSFGGNQGGAGGGTNRIFAPSYWRFDAFASYRISETVDLQLNVQNVADRDYIIRTNGVHHADYGPARQAILTLNVRY